MVQIRPHPFDSTPIDAIDRRLAQLRGVVGALSSVAHVQPNTEVLLCRDDLTSLCWLVQDYLDDIEQFIGQLHPSTRDAQPTGGSR